MTEKSFIKRVETRLENLLFSSRRLLAPFYFGLALSLVVLLIKFLFELLHLATGAFASTESEVILGLLTLVDLTLTGSLLIIVIFSGYENFVSKMDHSEHGDRPEWMGTIDFAALKLKMLSPIVAISAGTAAAAVHVAPRRHARTRARADVDVFVVSSVLLALSDRISVHAKAGGGETTAAPAGAAETSAH